MPTVKLNKNTVARKKQLASIGVDASARAIAVSEGTPPTKPNLALIRTRITKPQSP